MILVGGLVGQNAVAESPPAEKNESILDTATDFVSKGISFLGEKSEELLAPISTPIAEREPTDLSGLHTSTTREFLESLPIRADGQVHIASEFSEIRIVGWDYPVVQVKADIRVGAESPEVAEEVQAAIRIIVQAQDDRIAIRKEIPDLRELGNVVPVINYTIQVPQGIAVTCENSWGSTFIHGLSGAVTAVSRYGVVDLRQLSGPVKVRAVGEFPLQVYGLRQGGEFALHRTLAEFGGISGSLVVDNFMGSTQLRELASTADVRVTSDSGPVHLFMPESANPDIAATAYFGDVVSDVPLDRVAREGYVVARGVNVDATQRLELNAVFDNVVIHREGLQHEPQAPSEEGAMLEGRLFEEREVPAGTEVVFSAIVGDIRIEGTNENRLVVEGYQHIRILDPATYADAAGEALSLSLEQISERMRVRTAVNGELAGLGVNYHRIDLVVKCPRDLPIRVSAVSGRTTITGMGGAVTVVQEEGAIRAEQCTGPLDLTNNKGDIQVYDSTGALTASAMRGTLETRNIDGDQNILCEEGKVVIDAPRGGIVARQRGGDIFVIALDGIHAPYDIQAQQGDVNIVFPEDADVNLIATTQGGGDVRAPEDIVLTGTIAGDVRDFRGRLKDGTHRVLLESTGGDILID
jgi:hypothetical protein